MGYWHVLDCYGNTLASYRDRQDADRHARRAESWIDVRVIWRSYP